MAPGKFLDATGRPHPAEGAQSRTRTHDPKGNACVGAGSSVLLVRRWVMANGAAGDFGRAGAFHGSVDETVASALVEAAPDGMMLVDAQGQILLVNRQVEELFGYGRDDLVGQAVEVLLPERLGASHRAHRTRFRGEPRTRTMGAGLRLLGRRADGAQFPVEISLSPLCTDAGWGVVAVVRDITARVVAETETAHVCSVLDVAR